MSKSNRIGELGGLFAARARRHKASRDTFWLKDESLEEPMTSNLRSGALTSAGLFY